VSLEVDHEHRLDALERRLDEHCANHPLEHHDHLLDLEDHIHHHEELGESRRGERRSAERRTKTEKYEGEERRSA
jgi:hypothetical protein